MTRTINIGQNHYVNTGAQQVIVISIDRQNGVDTIEFVPPSLDGTWAWRVEIEQEGVKSYCLLDDTLIWKIEAGEVVEGDAKLQLVGTQQNDDST